MGYALILLAVVGFSYFYTNINRNQKSSIEEMRIKMAELNGTLEKANIEVDKINQQLETIQKDIREKFERLLDKESNYTMFVEQVQRKAKALEVEILNSTYEPPSRVQGAPATYLEFRFTMNASGSYENMKRFLWEMENALGRFVKIGKMAIRSPICDSAGKMFLTLTLSTFFLP